MYKIFSVQTKSKNNGIILFFLRLLGGGLMFYAHGITKFITFFSDEPVEFANLFGIGSIATLGLVVFAEFICTIFIVLGLFTRFAVIPLIITMAYAIFITHCGDPFKLKELPIFYLVIYVILFIFGSGIYSIDSLFFKEKRKLV